MVTKAQTFKDLVNFVLNDLMSNVFCAFNFKHRCLKQKIEIIRHLLRLQHYLYKYERSAIHPIQFLKMKSHLPKIQENLNLFLHTSQFSVRDSFSEKRIAESLGGVKIIEKGNRTIGNECLLKVMSSPEFIQSLTLAGVRGCGHISCARLNRVWVSDDRDNLILTNITGVNLHRLDEFHSHCESYTGYGPHTVNNEGDLIYINRNYNINKLSKDMKTTTTFIEKTDYPWIPWCVDVSPHTGDLLVGMYRNKPKSGKVTRYNQSGQLTLTIQHDNRGIGLYNRPSYIKENNNRDVVVSDSGTVVVTEYGGRHRFTYAIHPFGSKLVPLGICTDALSNILVCDGMNSTVQMLNKDGQFLSYLLIRPPGTFRPCSLSYDINTHRLWVGSYNNKKVCVYRYVTRLDTSAGPNLTTADAIESLNVVPTNDTEKPQQDNECLLQLMSHPKILYSFTVTDVESCGHISLVASDQVWINDRNNLIMTNTTGDTLDHLEDCNSDFTGLHTVNSDSELIYIDEEYDISKQSTDTETDTTFIQRPDFKWRRWSVYWSLLTGDLLVGMFNIKRETGKVTRYNQSGQLTQTIHHDMNGMELYRQPNYITENNNGDILVCDSLKVVVVVDLGGRHRFSYSGHPPGSGISPCGICTDAMSHILVCDNKTNTVHMLNKDGQFLSHLLTKEMDEPHSLTYDANTHRLWVGSYNNNKLCVYIYIEQRNALTVLPAFFPTLSLKSWDLADQFGTFEADL
uniref:Tripartite motif-containing protein 2 n=1 Tax=Magallana gigas TaxID=29159 RepID=K1Q2B4_MAGGI